VPANADRLTPLLDAGVLGLKCFLVDSGIAEFPPVGANVLRRAMPVLAARGVPLLAHAELPGPIARAPQVAHSHRYIDWLAARPPAAEAEAVALLVALAEATRCSVHVVHVACAEAVVLLRAARARGVPITGETCTHYLTFCAEEIEDGAVAFKCAPPIRDRSARAALWQGLLDGTLDYVASDHSPCMPSRKDPGKGDLMAAWGGIASLQLLLPALWTAMRRRGVPLERLLDWLCRRPAERVGLGQTKGRIVQGYDADLVFWHPHRTFVVRPANLHHRHPLTPYAGALLDGVIERTFVRGRLVYDRGRFPGSAAGRWLARSTPAVPHEVPPS
jgi:allantoinase